MKRDKIRQSLLLFLQYRVYTTLRLSTHSGRKKTTYSKTKPTSKLGTGTMLFLPPIGSFSLGGSKVYSFLRSGIPFAGRESGNVIFVPPPLQPPTQPANPFFFPSPKLPRKSNLFRRPISVISPSSLATPSPEQHAQPFPLHHPPFSPTPYVTSWSKNRLRDCNNFLYLNLYFIFCKKLRNYSPLKSGVIANPWSKSLFSAPTVSTPPRRPAEGEGGAPCQNTCMTATTHLVSREKKAPFPFPSTFFYQIVVFFTDGGKKPFASSLVPNTNIFRN